jgi:hypothetical protein
MHGLPPFAPATHPFADGLERDHAAVLAGLTLPCSSGAVEGKVLKAPGRPVAASAKVSVTSWPR